MFKDRIEIGISDAMTKIKIKELIKSIENNSLKELLFGNIEIEHVEHPYKNRSACAENPNESSADENESKIIRCLFYKNNPNTNKICENCKFKNKHNIEGKYSISDYRVPSYYQIPEDSEKKGIGAIDLVITDGTNEYATEIKPYKKTEAKNNESSLFKMIAEILTYTYGYPESKYKPAIAFFEDTPQEIEWINRDNILNELIMKANISVFIFKEISTTKHSNEKFTIEKLK